MQKSTLALYIQKVAEGDKSFAGRLCAQLADRLVYVPTRAQAKSGQRVKVSILRLFESGSFVVPVFTTERKLREWSHPENHDLETISLLGADFCSALDGNTSIWVDPGAEPNVKLSPAFVRDIAVAGGVEDDSRGTDEIAPPAVAEPMNPATTPAAAVSSPMASFPAFAPTSSSPMRTPGEETAPNFRAVRKEEFPPFVPPSAHSVETGQPTSRAVEHREPPPLETMRAHRSSLAAGALHGDAPRGAEVTGSAAGRGETPAEGASESHLQPDDPKRKSLFGLFSKKEG